MFRTSFSAQRARSQHLVPIRILTTRPRSMTAVATLLAVSPTDLPILAVSSESSIAALNRMRRPAAHSKLCDRRCATNPIVQRAGCEICAVRPADHPEFVDRNLLEYGRIK